VGHHLDLTRAVDVGLAGPLNIAGGLEYRRESYQIKSGDAASYYGGGAQSFFGYSPANASYNTRRNFAQYRSERQAGQAVGGRRRGPSRALQRLWRHHSVQADHPL
jgi:hypothetical protein